MVGYHLSLWEYSHKKKIMNSSCIQTLGLRAKWVVQIVLNLHAWAHLACKSFCEFIWLSFLRGLWEQQTQTFPSYGVRLTQAQITENMIFMFCFQDIPKCLHSWSNFWSSCIWFASFHFDSLHFFCFFHYFTRNGNHKAQISQCYLNVRLLRNFISSKMAVVCAAVTSCWHDTSLFYAVIWQWQKDTARNLPLSSCRNRLTCQYTNSKQIDRTKAQKEYSALAKA